MIPENPFPPNMICQRFSFKDGKTIILCNNGYPAPIYEENTKFHCPEVASCYTRWDRADEQLEYQEKKKFQR